jgi:hypothetical protein
MNSGPVEIITVGDDKENDPSNYGKKIYTSDYGFRTKQVIRDRHSGDNPKNYGYHPRLGHMSKSTMYDILGYIDRDTERVYACWKKENGKAQIKNSIQNVDIYDGLYDIK